MITHARIVERLAELRTTAEAASDGPWHVGADPADPDSGEAVRDQMLDVIAYAYVPADDRHIAAWSPAAALRWLSWAEQVAAEHGPGTLCEADCTEIHRLATALGLEET